MKHQEDAVIVTNARMKGDYFRVDLRAAAIARTAAPGQFVHVQFPGFPQRLLRRPFSIFNTEPADDMLSIIYKIVGEGTSHLSGLTAGAVVNLLGPLGVGFSVPLPGSCPIIVAGGYGCAATYLLARRSPVPGTCLIGGRSAGDLLLTDAFEELGWHVRVSTNDGSVGCRGLVTDLLGNELDTAATSPSVHACGPNPMLAAVAALAAAHGIDAEISLDHVMCCGVGACFACVVKLKVDTPLGWEYVRTCRHGPVFKASRVWWGARIARANV